MKPSIFLEKFGADAEKASRATGIPSLLILAQAALESGWGEKIPGNNFFGIKADSAYLAKGLPFHLQNTRETINGISTLYTAKNDPTGKYRKFRSYASPSDSFIDWGNFLKTNKRYSKVFSAKDSIQAARELQNAGYATAPSYSDSLVVVMHSISPASIPSDIFRASYARAFPAKIYKCVKGGTLFVWDNPPIRYATLGMLGVAVYIIIRRFSQKPKRAAIL